MKRLVFLSLLLLSLHFWTHAQYQFNHVKQLTAITQNDFSFSYQAIDQGSGERIICGTLGDGDFDFDPGRSVAQLSSAASGKALYVAKYSSDGDLVWAHRLVSSSSSISFTDIKVNANGDIYLSIFSFSNTGNTLFLDPSDNNSTHSFSLNKATAVVKYDKDFSYQWSRVFENTVGNDHVRLALKTTGITIALTTESTFDLNPDPSASQLFNVNGTGIGLIGLDANGGFVSGVGLEANGASTFANILDLETDGTNTYLSGHMGNFASIQIDLDPGATQNLVTGNKAFVAKYDGSFNLQVKLPIPNKRFDRQMNIHIAGSNMIYLAGSFNGTKDFGGLSGVSNMTSNGLADVFVALYDQNLDLQWARNWGGSDNDAVRGITLIGTNFLLQGALSENTTSTIGTTTTLMKEGAYAVSLSPTGDLDWYKNYNSSLNPLAINADPNGNIYTIGDFQAETIDFNPNAFFNESLAAGSNAELYLSKFTSCVTLDKTVNTTLCAGEVFQVEGIEYSDDRLIYEFKSAPNGCDSLIQTNLQFHSGSPIAASATISNPSDCGLTDGSITIAASGGNGFYFYSINDNTFQTSNVFSSLVASLYDLEVRDSNGCSVQLMENLKDPVQSAFELDPNTPLIITNVACAGAADGVAELNFLNFFGNPVDYSLNAGSFTPLSSFSFDNLVAGDYTLDLRTVDGCIQPLAFEITEPAESLTFSITSVTDATCASSTDAQIVVLASGGTPGYEYSLDGATYTPFISGSTTTIQNAPVGNVDIFVKDVNGCVETTTVAVGATPDIIPPSFTTPTSINLNENVLTVFYTAQATDNCGMVSYSITGGVDQAAFSIDISTGELSFVSTPDYENPTDVGGDNIYDVDITSTDESSNSTMISLVVTVTDLVETIIWSGATNSDWGTSSNWVGGVVPTLVEFATIPVSAVNQPIVSGEYSVNNLTIETGVRVEVNAESSLAIYGDFSGGGTMTILKNTTGNGGYSILGSPLSDWELSDLNAEFLYDFDGSTFFTPSGTMLAGKGYFVGFTASNPVVTFEGIPNTGLVSATIGTSGDAFNLVANPFTAAIDRAAFVSDNSSLIDGNIWLWNDGGLNSGSNRGGDYILVNNLGSASTVDLGDGIAGIKNLPSSSTALTSCQGFLVKATSTGSVTFNPTLQVSTLDSNSDGNFYRKSDPPREHSVIKLSLSNDSNYNEVLIGLVEGATFGKDYALDGPLHSINPEFSFHTQLNNKPFAIQALPRINKEVSIKLEMKVSTSGTYSFQVEHMAFLSDFNVSLLNEKTGISIPLAKKTQLSLNLSSDRAEGYSLVFSPAEVLGLDVESKFTLYGNTQELSIVSSLEGMQQVDIYDLSGKILFSRPVIFIKGHSSFSINLQTNQVYILMLKNQNIKFTLN